MTNLTSIRFEEREEAPRAFLERISNIVRSSPKFRIKLFRCGFLLCLLGFFGCKLIGILQGQAFKTSVKPNHVVEATGTSVLGPTGTAEVINLTWSPCHIGCCPSSQKIVQVLDKHPSDLVCFDVNFKQKVQRFMFLTTFNHLASTYLAAAKKFLEDISSQSDFCGEILWRIADDSTLEPAFVFQLSEKGIAVMAHSVFGYPSENTLLVPNFHFILSNGFSDFASYLEKNSKPFRDLHQQVFWAGTTTGEPCAYNSTCEKNCDGVERVKLARAAKSISWVRAKLSSTCQICAGNDIKLRNEGILEEPVPELDWIKNRGIIDIDGNVDAWGLTWRLMSNSVVFRVKSRFIGYFSNLLQDGVHFISLEADFSDLQSKTSVVLKNDEETLKHLSNLSLNARKLIHEHKYGNVVRAVALRLSVGLGSRFCSDLHAN